MFEDRAYLEAILATVTDGIIILGPEFEVMFVNKTFLRFVGSQNLEELSSKGFLQAIDPLDRPTFLEDFAAVLNGIEGEIGRPTCFRTAAAEVPSPLLKCDLKPFAHQSGKCVALVARFGSAESERDYKAEIAGSHSMVKAILATVPDAMVVIDEAGQIASFNAAAQALFGYSEEEVLKRNVTILMPEPHKSAHDGHINRYWETGQKRVIGTGRIVEGQRRDGTVFPMELSVGEACTGDYRAFTGFIRDLTQRHAREAQLQMVQSELIHASRLSAVGILSSAIAHELNQPLTAIANYVSAGRDMVFDDGPETSSFLHEALDEAAKEAVRAGQIVHRLRNFVSKGEFEPRVLSLSALIDDATALGLVGAREQSVSWSIQIDPDIDNVLADRVQIQQVMVNLMRNAIEAMENAPIKRLTIGAHRHRKNQVMISISDTGMGITQQAIEEVFHPFLSTKPHGMGLGLSICRTIVEAHGGKLTAISNPEIGATFRFTLTHVAKEHDDGK